MVITSVAWAQDGSINVTVSGGIPPYTYNWSNGFTSPNAIELPAGYYRLTVRDAALNSVVKEITLIEPEQLNYELQVYEFPNGYNVSCYNCYNGSVTVTIYGGTAPYTALWDDGNTNINRTSLGAGAIEAELTDQNGCQINIARTDISQPERSDWTMYGNVNSSPNANFIGTTDNVDLVFKTNSTERLRLINNGGIKLSSLSGIPGGLFVDNNGEINSANVDNKLSPCGFPSPIWLNLTNPLTLFTCLPVKVGIGTTTPQSLTGIAGNLSIGMNFASNNSAPSNGLIVEGHVGIGTNAPNAPLEIRHDQNHSGLILNRNNNSIFKSQIKFQHQGNDKWAIGVDANSDGNNNFFCLERIKR
ncbi:MAG: SprB repeat-containing protein [Bacteroidetes bacterium]|nr:SprB repeat-containing protein [Bacteroidota bacterium]